ncbi:MAG: LEVG family PEP-CTERM protein [Cyanomargarita calcarea GSE-NOS-MK-12-04C]|jgi:hypothetical protein|uniref:LEVG family PEP-CTERM protein n=1 Tax=Cyanomargarita calcarea GSE-NOS-MK-12-04C TaxID=2839659 RepID=A0A951QSL9_9CYAN|nr:LEVG family PEP-CTERM protein [Cyanomargarita calcarea GSE-NOS-MK-12-04C]
MSKLSQLVKVLVASTLGLSVLASMPAAKAGVSIVPTTEGEIKLLNNGDCLSLAPCIDTTSLGYTVTSLSYNQNNKTYSPSLLFSDDISTENTWGFGIKFDLPDAGTNPLTGINTFRPVMIKNGKPDENGQLEVGHFLFDFMGKTINEVTLDFHDVEVSGFSGILKVNGNPFSQLLGEGPNNSVQTLVLKDVKSFEVQLGKVGSPFPTGDGVDLNVEKVPEPTTTASLGLLAMTGMFGLRKQKNVTKIS